MLFIAVLGTRWRAELSRDSCEVPVRTVATVPDRNCCSGSFQPLQRSARVAEQVGSRPGVAPNPCGPVKKEPSRVAPAPRPEPPPWRRRRAVGGGGGALARVSMIFPNRVRKLQVPKGHALFSYFSLLLSIPYLMWD